MADGAQARAKRALTKRELAPTTPDAIEIAMEAAASGTAPRGPALELLVNQNRLVRWETADKRASFGLKVLTALAGLAVVVGLGAMAWSASRDHSLTLIPFESPPDLAARGLSGKVLASRLQDRLSRMQEETKNYDDGARVHGGDAAQIKVEIPGTGLSLAEVQRLFHDWLSPVTVVSGELSWATLGAPEGAMALSLRVGDEPGAELTQPDGDVGALLKRAAEQVYEVIAPVRYGEWLGQHGRADESRAVFLRATTKGPDASRAAAYVRLADGQPPKVAELYLRASLRLDPHYWIAWNNLASSVATPLGREEEALDYLRRSALEVDRMADPEVRVRIHDSLARPVAVPVLLGAPLAAMDAACADYRVSPCTTEALADAALIGQPASFSFDRVREQRLPNLIARMAGTHDTKSAARMLLAPRDDLAGRSPAYQATVESLWLGAAIAVATCRQDWSGLMSAVMARDTYDAATARPPDPQSGRNRAIALAHLGRFAEAEAAISPTPLDCYACLRARGQVAALKGDHGASNRWFASAVRDAPSYPQAHAEWGEALLARGDVAGSIGQLQIANRKSPHFADPVELWGEALLRQGDAAGAAAKFAEAAKLAPSWGRLYLKWGEALAKLGKVDQAHTQWRTAAGLDLTAAERAETTAVSRNRTL